jgi:hypothetical protein
MNRISTAIIAAAVLTGCGSGGEPGEAAQQASASTPEACAQGFMDRMQVWPGQPDTKLYLSYLFEASPENVDLLKNGLEGIRPDIVATMGSGAERLTDEQVALALRKGERPRLVYFAERQPRLGFAPERAYSRDEARAHVVDMCRLRDRGLVLREVQLSVNAGSS